MSIAVVAAAVERLARRVGLLWAKSEAADDAARKYVQSRGSGLITNGFGLLKDNTNFSRMEFDASDAYAGFGCFVSAALAADVSCDELIPVNPGAEYEFSFAARTVNKAGASQAYSYLMCCDMDGHAIQPHNLPFVSFRLAEPLAAGGQPVVAGADIEKVRAAMPAKLASQALLFLGASDYVSAGGFRYPKGSYTRKFYGAGISGVNVRFDGGTGRFSGLSTNLLEEVLPAGAEVVLGQTGGSYVYWLREMSNTTIPEDWTVYKVKFAAAEVFRPFTAMIKIGWLVNRGSRLGNKQAFSAINLREV